MGGGEQLPMDVLKNWMHEKWDFNEACIQNTGPELAQHEAEMAPDVTQIDESILFTTNRGGQWCKCKKGKLKVRVSVRILLMP